MILDDGTNLTSWDDVEWFGDYDSDKRHNHDVIYVSEDLSGLENWNVSNVNDIEAIFADCHSLNNLSHLNEWNVKKEIDKDYIFPTHISKDDYPKWGLGDSDRDGKGLDLDSLVNLFS